MQWKNVQGSQLLCGCAITTRVSREVFLEMIALKTDLDQLKALW